MMSSATSTDAAAPTAHGRHEPAAGQAADQGFHVWHFFVLLSLLAATAVVVVARPSAPENLILLSLTIGAAGAAGVGLYRTLAPLIGPARDPQRGTMSRSLRIDLEREKALTLRSIKELEFDRAMGKLSTQDFDEMSGRLRARALGIMKQLDAGSSAYRTLIEKELAARIGKPGKPGPPPGREASADHRSLGGGGQAGRGTSQADVCSCGTPNDADARFCKSCGAKLEISKVTK